MKKLSVLLVAAAVAISASAGVNFKTHRVVKSNKVINTEMTKFNPKNLKAKNDFRVITDEPAGELKTYNRTGNMVYNDGYSIYAGTQDGNRMDIVYGEDGKVYMKNILCQANGTFGDSWVEGTIEGNEIHVALGQSIYWSEDYQANVVLCMATSYVEDGYLMFEKDERAEEIVYLIDGETITMQGTYDAPSGSEYPAYEGYGLTAYWEDDNSWSYFIEWNTVLTEREPVIAPELISEVPEGCEILTFYRNSGYIASSFFGISNGTTDGKINVAFDANGDVYIQNPSWWSDSYNTWVKGTYDAATGIISIPTGQYLSWSDEYEYGIQLGWGSTTVYESGVDEETGETTYGMNYEIDERTTEIQFLLDGNNFYLLGSEGDVNAEFPQNYVSTGMLTYWSDDQSFSAIEFANRDENGDALPMGYIVNLVPAVPANPSVDEWYDCGDESGFSRLYFTLPTTDADGNMLDPEYISYSIFVDNGNGPELFTFPAADYTYDLVEDITEVTYDVYSSAIDFRDYFCYFYRTNADGYEPLFTQDIGIQVYYTVNGVKNHSDFVMLYGGVHSGVNELVNGKTVANVRYYNVAGQEMAQPSGMTIQVTTYTDGTRSAVKVVK